MEVSGLKLLGSLGGCECEDVADAEIFYIAILHSSIKQWPLPKYYEFTFLLHWFLQILLLSGAPEAENNLRCTGPRLS